MSTRLSLQDLPVPVLEVGINTETDEQVIVLTQLSSRDPSRPDNWDRKSKLLVLAAGILTDFNSTLGSSLPSNAITFIADDFHIHDEVQLVLPISLYIIGFVFGPMLYGPLSETYGRKPGLLLPLIGYAAFTLGCALASSWPMFLVFRCLCGLMASSPIAIIGGLYADIYSDETRRGVYLTYFIAVSAFGPCLGPLLSGAISQHTTWRWVVSLFQSRAGST